MHLIAVYQSERGENLCDLDQFAKCFSPAMRNYTEGKLVSQCPCASQECTSTVFDYSNNNAELTDELVNYLVAKYNRTTAEVRRNYIKMDIFMKAISITKLKTVISYTSTQLLSDIGTHAYLMDLATTYIFIPRRRRAGSSSRNYHSDHMRDFRLSDGLRLEAMPKRQTSLTSLYSAPHTPYLANDGPSLRAIHTYVARATRRYTINHCARRACSLKV